jgi:RNA polymerase sigma factor (sigma-70 family)
MARLIPAFSALRPVAPDARLLAALPDPAAFAEIVRRHGPMVFAVCRRMLGHHQDAEDAFQAAFVVLHRRADRVANPAALGCWLHGVAVRVSRDVLSARRRHAGAPLIDEPTAADHRCPAELAEVVATVDAAVADLPAHYRDPVVLCELQGQSRHDAASALGIPEGTVASRLAKARRLLAGRLGGRALAVGVLVAGEARVPAALLERTVGPASPAVQRIAEGVLSTMSAIRFKTLAVAVLVLFGIGGLALLNPVPDTALAPTVGAAPAPKRVGENLIWLKYPKTNKVVAMTPAGKVVREINLPEKGAMIAFSPVHKKLWFGGRDGKPVTTTDDGRWPKEAITLHVRDLADGVKATDLGVAYTEMSVLSPDGTAVGRVDKKQNGTVDQPFVFENFLVDVATRKETKLDLPPNHQLFGIAADKKWVLSFEYATPGAEKGTPPYRLHRHDVATGKTTLLSGTVSALYGSHISPDGTKVLTFGEDLAGKDGATWDLSVYVIDAATTRMTRIGGQPNQLSSVGTWSADGSRIAYAWRARATDGPIDSNGVPPTRLVVCDADGRNAATILTSDEEFFVLAWW